MVLIGRSTLYGTAAAGYQGAKRALDIYRSEISRGMAQISCNTVSEIGREHIAYDWELQGASIARPGARVPDSDYAEVAQNVSSLRR
jgi:isopentenyl diphosphate isomerase/L-lactate dehydrogenase-like FMN-dependent dehydrogenase